jgi:DNA-binding GntR family transcriptional regulator
MKSEAPLTRTEVAYRQIRDDLTSGRIRPGSQLLFSELKDNYLASMGVLREALARLSAEGLVQSFSNRGFQAMALSIEDLKDLTRTRCNIEPLVLEDSVRRGDLDWESRVISARHRMERTPKEDASKGLVVTPEWAAAHQRFHEELISASVHVRLKKMAASLRNEAEVYRSWSIGFEAEKRDVPAEHNRLMELALARDAGGAAAALHDHLDLTLKLVLTGTSIIRPDQ